MYFSKDSADQNNSSPNTMEDVIKEVKLRMEQLVYGTGSSDSQKEDGIAIAKLHQALHDCGLGGDRERVYVKEYIKEIISEGLKLDEDKLNKLISFERSSKLTDLDRFEILLYIYSEIYGTDGLSKMFDNVDKDFLQNQHEIDKETLKNLWNLGSRKLSFLEKLDIVTQRVYEELYGFSVCDMLISGDTAVDSVSAGCGGILSCRGVGKQKIEMGHEVVYIMLHGRKVRLSFLGFASENALERVVKKLGRNHPRVQLSRKNSYLVTGLRNNARVVVTRPPVSEGWTFYVRKFNTSPPGNLEGLLSGKAVSLVISMLRMLVGGCQNLVITGEQASGKTTLLKRLVGFIDKGYSIRVAEQAFELRLNELYPDRNIHTLQEYGDSTVEDAITLFKKTDTDVTICGEINEPAAADALVQVCQSGGRFTMCTSHHQTSDKLVDYMRNALLKHSGLRNEVVATSQVLDAIHFDVHLQMGLDGQRKIARITELWDDHGKFKKQDILKFEQGAYQFCGKIHPTHANEIRRAYSAWNQEEAAYTLSTEKGE